MSNSTANRRREVVVVRDAMATPASHTRQILVAVIGVLAYVGALIATTIGELP